MRRNSQFKRTNDVLLGVLPVGAVLMTGCNLDLAGVAGGPTGLDKISLTGPSTVQVGDTIRLTATGVTTGAPRFLL